MLLSWYLQLLSPVPYYLSPGNSLKTNPTAVFCFVFSVTRSSLMSCHMHFAFGIRNPGFHLEYLSPFILDKAVSSYNQEKAEFKYMTWCN